MKVSKCTVFGEYLSPYSSVEVPPGTQEIRVAISESYGDTDIIVEFIPIGWDDQRTKEGDKS